MKNEFITYEKFLERKKLKKKVKYVFMHSD